MAENGASGETNRPRSAPVPGRSNIKRERQYSLPKSVFHVVPTVELEIEVNQTESSL